MALMIVLWLLILRGVAIEFRSHQDNPLWREFWDTVFVLASALLAVLFGTTLGNLIRGVPLGKEGLHGMPLFTNFLTGRQPGILDWYTALVGFFTLAALAVHGALYLVWRTAGPVQERSLTFARAARKAMLVLWAASTVATGWVQPHVITSLFARPWAAPFVAIAIAGAWGIIRFARQGHELAGFISSSAFLLGMVATVLAGHYPYWIRSTIDPSYDIAVSNNLSARHGMGVALVWWTVGIVLIAGYFTYLFRSMRGKVAVDTAAGS
jgi:cytochrome d ubiquinol oxidase subunit II